MDHADIVAVAAAALAPPGKEPVTLRLADIVVDYPGAACVILRCTPMTPSPDIPSTVIVKRWNERGGHFRHEWSALEFLARVPAAQDLVPRLYGGDAGAELLVLEDLGDPSEQLLGNILTSTAPERAEVALVAFNQALGRLHASTIGRAEEYRRIRESQGAHAVSRHAIHRLDAALQALPGHVAAIGVRVSPALEREVRAAIRAIHAPGPFLAFTHGDATPGNAFYAGDRARLFDLETAGFRHALLDGAFARMRYLYSVWARRIPQDIQRRSLAAYRRALVCGCPAAADDGVFAHAILACSAGWLAALCAHLPSVMEADKRFGRSTWRQRIVAGLDHFVTLANDLGRFEALAGGAGDVARRLRLQWPTIDCTLPPYEAFVEQESSAGGLSQER